MGKCTKDRQTLLVCSHGVALGGSAMPSTGEVREALPCLVPAYRLENMLFEPSSIIYDEVQSNCAIEVRLILEQLC